jgi:PGF-pre-PGF domain-containing protein
MFSYGNSTPAWTLQTASAGWRARLSPARIATPDSKKALLSTGGTKETRTGGNSTDPFAVIDEKLAPSEAAGLKSLIQNTLHAFSYNEATGDWYARNAANRITFTYTRDGTAKFSGGENAFGLTLLGIGRDDGFSPAGKGHVQAEGRQLNITRPEYTEWYRNNDAGVEQGITIANRPAGSGLLQVGFGLTGNNSLSLKDTKTLILIDASGTPSFEYTGLHAFSSDGRDLPASLATDGTTLSWVVDDTGAVYPVTIDPVVVSASKATATFTGGAGGDIGSFTGGDFFGTSVALNSSGTMALVGAVGNSTAASNAGAAYIFTMPAGGWSSKSASAATATFTGIGDSDNFGNSVALNSSGAVALIGASQPNTATGAAYIFTMPTGGWSGTTSASAATATFTGIGNRDNFGNSVALNSSGAVALIGAYLNDTTSDKEEGAAYIFTMPTGGWSGTTSASAANATFNGGATQDNFGNSVALNSSGTMALIGAPNNKTAAIMGGEGAAYIFTMPAGGWSGTNSASAANAQFTGGARDEALGWSVALSSDGTRALIGAHVNDTAGSDAGAAYIFEAPGGVWGGTTSASAANATFTGGASGDYFGYSVALSSDGTRALVGACYNDTAGTDAGAAYTFTMPAGGWSGTNSASTATFTGGAGGYQGQDDPYGDYLGWSVALNSSGGVALVGATYNQTAGYRAGAAYIFQPPYVPLTATGITTGAAGTAVVNGLELNPTTTLTNVDLYLGTSNTTITGTKIKTGVASLPASVATTVDGVSLVGKTAGTYYIIACESGTTSILGATTSEVYTVTATPSLDGVIGFRWNTSDPSPRLYQIDSNGAVIDHNGTWFNDHLPWSGMKTVVVNASNSTPVLYGTNNRGDGLDLTGTYGDVMVEIPLFYTCSTYSNGNFSYWISPTAQDALHYTVAPMFNQRGTGTEAGTAASYYYVGRYDANLAGNKLQSATDKSPNVDMTLGAARTYAENKGAGWGITNVWTLSALRQLFYTEMVTLDSQTAWTGSRGVVDTGGSNPSKSGAEGIDAAIYSINATGNGTGLNGKTPVSYRGIENLWGNVWQFQDGFTATTTGSNVINATGLGLTGQATTFATPLGVNDIQAVGALPAEGWQINLTNTDGARPIFLPSQTSTTDYTSSYLSDYYYAPRSESAASPNILQSGGYCDDGGKAGVGALAPSDIASYTYAVVGARLEFRRTLVPVVSFSSRNASAATNTSSQGWAGVAPFTMVFNDTSTGTPVSWVWSATNVTGNNVPFYINTTTVTLANISYEFKTAGNYTIKLNATNSLGSDISTQVTWVNVSAAPVTPVASFSSRNTSAATNTSSQGWAGVAPFTMVFNDTSTNNPTSWKWGRNNLTVATWEQFSTTNNATQTFVAGNWSVNLTATNSAGSGISGITWVNVSTSATPPVASFSSRNTSAATNTSSQGWSGVAPFTMVFNDTSTNSPTSWKWGRNNLTVATWEQFSTTNNATQTFVAGNWSVNLTATNSAGSGISGITWVNVSTSPASPVAGFTGTPLSGTAPLAVTFTDTSTGTPTSWNWVFGDGNTSTIQSPVFTYVTSGYFTVKLTAANAFGSSAKTISQYIAVAAVSRQNSTENKNITQTISSGQTNVNVSTCDPGMTVTNTTTQVLVTNPALGWQKYTFEGANITKNTCYVNISVSNVTMDSTPFTAPLPGLGTVSTSLTIGQNQTTSGTLQQEIIPGANTTVTNAFQLAATNIGLTLGNIAYTLQIGGAAPFNRNLTSSGVIINMSASHSWVLANGGTGAIRIFRYSDTGAVQVLPTTFVGTDAGSIDYFRATSVNGFSEFGLGGTSTTPGPSGGGGGGGDSDGPVSMVTPQQVPGTTKVNVGGDSAVTQVAITGTGISGVIVTGTVVSGPGLNTEPPSRMVYEYVDITPARYATISEAVISFTVPVTWLTERQLTPPNVVMYHLVGQTWVALPTTLVKVENGVAYYTAASPGFSRFAITGQAGVTSGTPLATHTPAGQTFGDLSRTTSVTKTPTAAVTVRPVTTQTTAIPAASQPAPALPLPTMAIVGGIVVVLVAGGFLIRRWWIRRQNPALFRNYD